MNSADRVVLDCNIFFQAFLSEDGPAGRVLAAVGEKSLTLFISQYVLDELQDVLSRPSLAARFKFTSERVERYLALVEDLATLIEPAPSVFEYPRDPKDAH
jgi:putative PIN family toxin of toxin-antitoxin system